MKGMKSKINPVEDLARWFEQLAEAVCNRLAANQRVRRTLPTEGRLRIDRQLPFLCVYRQPEDHQDRGTRELIIGEAAYLFAAGSVELQPHLEYLCERVVATLGEHFGTFLLLEVWSLPWPSKPVASRGVKDLYCEVQVVDPDVIPATVEALVGALQELRFADRSPAIHVRADPASEPPGRRAVRIPDRGPGASGLVQLGLGIGPIYRDPVSGALYPVVLRALRQQVAFAIRKEVAAFTGDVHRDGHTSEG